ncbi:MAG: hypothetical protein MPJ22_01555 [Pirellulales bacterium]|nr:hypothetical protein [Alphaproteobacteria bacterium]MDA8041097.1 hypothetical protein [Pirellulales bacterium]
MSGNSKIIYKIEGLGENNSHLDLPVLVAKFAEFEKFLAESIKELGDAGAVFRVVDLSHSSPVSMTCELVGAESSTNFFRGVNETFAAFRAGETDRLPYSVRTAFESFAKSSSGKIVAEEIECIADGGKRATYKLDRELLGQLEDARTHEVRAFNTVDGKLEQINIHGNAKQFKIYDLNYAIACHFSKDMLSSVKKALGRHVSVFGECVYRPNDAFPRKIYVQKMEQMPDPKSLPSLSDLYGIAPDAAGGKSSEDFVRELRDEWD